MTVATAPDTRKRHALGLAWFTIVYNAAEGVVAVVSGIASGAVSLIGFGLDSGIEMLSAVVVLTVVRAELHGRDPDERRERIALRVIAGTFLALAVYLTVDGVHDLATAARPDVSPVGIAVTAASVVIMPLVAAAKARVGRALGSQVILADAAETRLCALLSVSTSVGLVAYAVVGWAWIDPVAGFLIALFALNEARGSWTGDHE